jgi:hypothetical protein
MDDQPGTVTSATTDDLPNKGMQADGVPLPLMLGVIQANWYRHEKSWDFISERVSRTDA